MLLMMLGGIWTLNNESIEHTYDINNPEITRRDSEFYGRDYFTDRVDKMLSEMRMSSIFYKEVLRSLLSSMSLSYIDDQSEYKEVKLHHGRQERTIAKKFQENNLILPYSTLYQSAVAEDPGKRRSWGVLQMSKKWDDATQRAQRVVSYVDIPVKIEYTLSIWSKYVSHLDQLSSQIRSNFNPHKNLSIKDTNILKGYLSLEQDISKTDVGDQEERLLRKTFTIEVQGYIPSPKFLLTNTGKITSINTDFWI